MWMLALYIGQYLCENELYSCISACGTDYIHFILLLSGSGITLGCCKQLINWCPKHDSIGQEGCILFLKVIRMALRILMHDYLIIGVWSAKAFSVKCFSATRLSEMALLRLIGVLNMIKSCLRKMRLFSGETEMVLWLYQLYDMITCRSWSRGSGVNRTRFQKIFCGSWKSFQGQPQLDAGLSTPRSTTGCKLYRSPPAMWQWKFSSAGSGSDAALLCGWLKLREKSLSKPLVCDAIIIKGDHLLI